MRSGLAGAAADGCCRTVRNAFGDANGVRRSPRDAPDDPAHGVKKPPVRKMERFLSEAEIGRLAVALDEYVTDGGNEFAAAAIKLLLLTGARRNEILSLQWRDMDSSGSACACATPRRARKSCSSTRQRWRFFKICPARRVILMWSWGLRKAVI